MWKVLCETRIDAWRHRPHGCFGPDRRLGCPASAGHFFMWSQQCPVGPTTLCSRSNFDLGKKDGSAKQTGFVFSATNNR